MMTPLPVTTILLFLFLFPFPAFSQADPAAPGNALVEEGQYLQALRAYNQCGKMLVRQDDYVNAGHCLNLALRLGDSLAPNLPQGDSLWMEIATTYITLGVLHNAREEYDKSLNHHFKALEIRYTLYDSVHVEIASSYGNIGNVYYNMGQFEQAVVYHTRAETIRLQLFGPNSPEIAESWYHLGRAWQSLEDYEKSLSYYEKALNNKILQLGGDHAQLARYYTKLAEVYSLTGNEAKAEEYSNRSKALKTSAGN